MGETLKSPSVGQSMNVVVGRDQPFIHESIEAILADGRKCSRAPERWDGHASERMAAHASLCFFRCEEPASA